MKKLLFVLLAFNLLIGFSVKSQTISIPDVVQAPGTVNIPVNYDFTGLATDVCSFTIDIGAYTSVMTLTGHTSSHTGTFTPNYAAGIVSFSATSPYVIPAGPGQLLTLQFTYTGGSAPINFDIPTTSLNSCEGLPVTASITFANGSIAQAPAVPVSNWSIFLIIGLIVLTLSFGARKVFLR